MQLQCLVVCVFFSLSSLAQSSTSCEYRVEYAAHVVMDTAKSIYFKNWPYTLIRKGDVSRFYETNQHFNDSMTTVLETQLPSSLSANDREAAIDRQIAESSNWLKDCYLGFKVEKDFSTNITKIGSYRILPPAHLEVNPSNFEWQITGEKDTFLGLNVVEAKINYGGRFWTAWYAPDIPISDGPYSFSGLPGLIVKIADERHWYNFELKNFAVKNVNVYWGGYFIHDLSQPVSRTQYVGIADQAKNNPRIAGVIDPSPEYLLRIKKNAEWKFFMLLEK